MLVFGYDTTFTFICSAAAVIGHYLAYRFMFRSSWTNKKHIMSQAELKKRIKQKREKKLKIQSIQETMGLLAHERAEIESKVSGLVIQHALFGKHSLLKQLKEHNNTQSYMENNDLLGNVQDKNRWRYRIGRGDNTFAVPCKWFNASNARTKKT